MKLVTVTVKPNGQATIETEGFVGMECVQATAGLERRLGGNGAQVLKPEALVEEQGLEQGQ